MPDNETSSHKNINEGLPEIATDTLSYQRKMIILVAGFAVGFLALSLIYFFGKNATTLTKPLPEEEYTLPTHSNTAKIEVPYASTDKLFPLPIPSHLQESTQKQALLESFEEAIHKRLQAPVVIFSQNTTSSANSSISLSTNSSETPSHNNNENNNKSRNFSTRGISPPSSSKYFSLSEGTLIPAILETAINSDLPGFVRATTSSPIYSDEGSILVIPAGSRLVGEYKSQTQLGQARLFIVWNTLMTPNGTRLSLSSPGTDNLGVAGLNATHLETHFWQRFETAALLSLISAGASNVGINDNDNNNASQQYWEALSSSFAQSAEDSMQSTRMIGPTLHIPQGQPILVFLAHPLYFPKSH